MTGGFCQGSFFFFEKLNFVAQRRMGLGESRWLDGLRGLFSTRIFGRTDEQRHFGMRMGMRRGAMDFLFDGTFVLCT